MPSGIEKLPRTFTSGLNLEQNVQRANVRYCLPCQLYSFSNGFAIFGLAVNNSSCKTS